MFSIFQFDSQSAIDGLIRLIKLGPNGEKWEKVGPVAFTGTFDRTIDDKHRIAIPKAMRDEFITGDNKRIYAAPGNDKCIAVYSEKSFEEYAEKLKQLSSARSEVRNFLRIFYSQAEGVEPDKQGRIRLPGRLVSFARLESQVVLVGVRDHAEIWEKSRWEELLATHAEDFDALALAAMESEASSSPR